MFSAIEKNIKRARKDHLELIRQKVQDAMANSMASFTFEDIIDHADLTEGQKSIARKKLDWKVCVV